MAISRIKRTTNYPDDPPAFTIDLPLYIRQEFLGPYGLGTAYRKIDITDLEFLLNKKIVYRITKEPVELFIRLKKDITTENGKTVRYISIVNTRGHTSTQTYIRIVNTLKI